MITVFCCSPLNTREVDEDYRSEYAASASAGFEPGLFSYEDLVYDRNPAKSVSRIPEPDSETPAFYRGWMLTPDQYSQLYDALISKRIRLLTSPEQYKHCHWLPEWYPEARDLTPKTTWLPADTPNFLSTVSTQLAVFENRPLVIKDYVKSQKHSWEEACYIPSASDTEHAMGVVNRFLELQGEDIQGGLVIREFVELAHLTNHSKSGMPLSLEYRVFFACGKPVQILPYWEEGDYSVELPDLTPFLDLAAKVQSPFFTMDLAKLNSGNWTIMELGDGQVSGLPETADPTEFYRRLAAFVPQLR